MGGPTALKLATSPVVRAHGGCPSSVEAQHASFSLLNPNTKSCFLFYFIIIFFKLVKNLN